MVRQWPRYDLPPAVQWSDSQTNMVLSVPCTVHTDWLSYWQAYGITVVLSGARKLHYRHDICTIQKKLSCERFEICDVMTIYKTYT